MRSGDVARQPSPVFPHCGKARAHAVGRTALHRVVAKNAFDTLRLKTERRTVEDFLDDFEALWPGIVEASKK